MNHSKAQFFSSQVDEPWAAADYTADERRKIDRILDAAGVRPGMRVLQPGCGTGRITVLLADLVGPAGLVAALDISPEMVAACRKRVAARTNVRLLNVAIEDFDDDREGFDLVICHNVYPHFDNKGEVTKKLASLLQSSGRMVVSHLMNSAWINDMHRKTDPAVLNDIIPDPEEMESIFSVAGLRIDLFQDDERGYLLVAARP